MIDNLEIIKSNASLIIGNDFNNTSNHIYYDFRCIETENEKNILRLQTSNNNQRIDLKNTIQLLDKRQGITSVYNLFGEHNKPRGTYVGNGGISTISINIDNILNTDTNIMVIIGNGATTLVFISGAISFFNNQIDITRLKQSEINFSTSKLTINSDNERINLNGTTYYYRIL